MTSEILSNKPVIGTEMEDFRLDLVYPSKIPGDFYPAAFATELKPEDAMRPDLLSLNMVGDVNSWDLILKANGVSNPFSIDGGDIFFSPDLEDMRKTNAPSGRQTQAAATIRDQYINPEKKSLTDSRLAILEAKRLEAMKKKSMANGGNGNFLPPNVASEGDREIVIKGGKIYFGKDVVKGVEECTEPISKSEFLAKLIKSRIK